MSNLAAELVRSLFCGLPRQENRMAVVVISASDESSGATHRSPFLYAGFLAPEKDWSNFAQEWDDKVLSGSPRIPYLHMTEIRSRKWREQYNLSETEAERRVHAAFSVIAATPSLIPAGNDLDAGQLLDTFTDKVTLTSGANKKFAPEYLAFPGYAYMVLMYCHYFVPEAEKVDFIVERKGQITDHIKEFYEGLPITLRLLGLSHLIPLMGDIIPGGKDRVPLQAADVLCWYTQRYSQGTLDEDGMKQYEIIAKRKGPRFNYQEQFLNELWENLHKEKLPHEQGLSEVQQCDDNDPSGRPESSKSCDGSGETRATNGSEQNGQARTGEAT